MDSFGQVYELYFKDVYRYVLYLSQDASVAEEVTQETFFRAMKSMPSFRGECKMSVWLCQIAKHIYFADKKKQKRRQDVAARLKGMPDCASANAAGDMPSVPDTSHSLESLLCDEADAMKIHGLLHELEEPYKEVFMLRVFGELPFKKIAHIFGKTESWARVTYHRARLKIVDRMEESNGKDIM